MTDHLLGRVAEVPVGEGRAFAVEGEQIAVFRLRDGGVRAVQAVCQHRGGPLADGLVDDTVFVCPLHGHAYRLADGCSPTGQAPLAVYPVRVEPDGALVVSTPGPRHAAPHGCGELR